MRKLLVICDEYAYRYNGIYYLRHFGYCLVSRYLEVFEEIVFSIRTKNVFTESELGPFNIPVVDSRIKICPIPFFQGPLQYLKNFKEVQKILNSSLMGCDAAIFRIPSTVAFAGLEKWRKTNKPFALEIVANPKEISLRSTNISGQIFMRLMHKQQLKACKEADGISYVTEHSLQKLYPARKEDHFLSYYSSVELSDSLFLTPRIYPQNKKFNICHVANPIKTHNKGHSTVIKVVHYLVKKGFDVNAKFAGDGDFIPFFINEANELGIRDRINFVGLLDQKGLEDFLHSSDLMLFPSKSEGLPRVLIEAMAAALPCLSTPVGGIPELLPDDLLYTDDDISGFANKIIQIISKPKLYEDLSIYSFNKAKEFSRTNLQSRRVEFYTKLKERIVR